jgi:hypothetical protein
LSLEFIDKIYGSSQGLIDIVTFGSDGKPNSERWFEFPEERDRIEQYIGWRADEDVFTSVNLFSSKKRTNADTEAVARAVGVDADTCHPDNFRVPPSARVQTGEGRWHCWWFLDEEVPAAEAALTAKRICTAHESQGCDKPYTHNVAKILRVPGTTNTKHANDDDLMWEVEVEYDPDAPLYTLDTLNAVYDDIAVGALAARQEATITAADFDSTVFSPDEIDRLHEYARVAWEADLVALDAGMVPGSWHTTGYKVACNMFRNANVQWSPYTQKDVIAEVNRAAQVDSPSSQKELDRIITDAIKEVGSDSLAMPAWALELLPDKPPEAIRGAALRELEARLQSLGLVEPYTSGLKEGETATTRTIALSKSLFRAGLNAREVFSLMIRASANTNKNKRSATSVWADVQLSAEKVEVDQSDEAKPSDITFLDDRERAYLEANPCFVDRYADWVKARTDSAPTYSQSLAWMVLSAVYADRGFMPLAWGPQTPLNLWLLVLGDTTRTRKSTARNFYLRLIRAYEEMTGEKIDVGSNTTSEAIVQELGKRDGKTSLLHTDEVNGFFRNVYTKNYATGTLETLTELYDGDVQVTLRATQGAGNKNRAKTQFLFLGVGIRKETAEILTKRNFESGFLARMLWSVADPPLVTKTTEAIQFFQGETAVDETMDDLLDELVASARKFNVDNRQPVFSDEAALKRINAWAQSAEVLAAKLGDPEVLAPSLARLTISVQKAASLLALHEGSTTVTIRHMLFALRQAEAWFRDMVRMAGEVSSSEFERRLIEVEAWIAGGKDNGRTDQQVRKQFAKLRPQEADEVLRALQQQGRIRKDPDNSKRWQALGS